MTKFERLPRIDKVLFLFAACLTLTPMLFLAWYNGNDLFPIAFGILILGSSGMFFIARKHAENQKERSEYTRGLLVCAIIFILLAIQSYLIHSHH